MEKEVTHNTERRDSLRKILPTKPSTSDQSRFSMSGKLVERPTLRVEKPLKMYSSYFLEYALLAEFQKFKKETISGVYLNPADKTPLVWYGTIFLQDGPYKGGVFRFEIIFPSTFPEGDCPRVQFSGDVFHPSISQASGDLNVAAKFPVWQSTNHVWQIILYIKQVFSEITPENPLNLAAAKMLVDEPEEFTKRVQQSVNLSQQQLASKPTNDDLNYIRFEPNVDDGDIYDDVLTALETQVNFN